MDFFMSFTEFEVRFLFFLQDYVRTPLLTYIFEFLTALENAGMLSILICLVMLAVKKTRRIGITASISLILSTLAVNVIIKPLAARTRPFDEFKSLSILVSPPADYSFPSGHSAAAFSVAFVIFLCMPKKYGIPAVITASLIAFSRLYIGVHYPSDVVIGTLIGCAAALLAKYLYKKIPALNHNSSKTEK